MEVHEADNTFQWKRRPSQSRLAFLEVSGVLKRGLGGGELTHTHTITICLY